MASERIQPLVHVSLAVVHDGGILMVQEEKPAARGLWNLPGGHVERGETILHAAHRELLEETLIDAAPEALLGIYSGPTSVRFVFRLPHANQPFAAGDEIMAAKFMTFADLRAMPDDSLVCVAMLRKILVDAEAAKAYGVDMFV